MIDKRESDFIFIRWLLFIVALTIFLIIFYKFGFINDLIENDVSFISPIIIIIFILFTGHVGYILYKLRKTHQACLIFKDKCISTEKFNKSQLVSFNSTNNPFLTIIYNHFKNLNTFMNNESPSESSKKELITIFEYKFTKILETGWFISDFLLKLGLVGTVIGFILMLNSVTLIENFDLTMMQNLLQQMSGGMKVALYTTLSGLITSILLSLQYKYLEDNLLNILNMINEIIELYPFLIKNFDNEKI